jgi:hypothetical protein
VAHAHSVSQRILFCDITAATAAGSIGRELIAAGVDGEAIGALLAKSWALVITGDGVVEDDVADDDVAPPAGGEDPAADCEEPSGNAAVFVGGSPPPSVAMSVVTVEGMTATVSGTVAAGGLVEVGATGAASFVSSGEAGLVATGSEVTTLGAATSLCVAACVTAGVTAEACGAELR